MEDNTTLEANVESPTEQATGGGTTLSTEGPVIPEKFGGDVGKLVESYNHLESKIGSMYTVPSEDSSQEKWSEFDERVSKTGRYISRPDPTNKEQLEHLYSQLGRPESPDKYSVQIAEEIQPYVDNNMYSMYTQVAHTAGLNNEQAQVLFDFEAQRMTEQAEASMQAKTQAENSLRQSWGHDYEARMSGAKAAASVYSEKYPDAINELLNGPSGNNPALIAILSELGSTMQESGHVGAVGTPQYGVSSDDAKDKIREIMDNRSHAYFNAADPGHSQAVSKVKKLYSIAYPEG